MQGDQKSFAGGSLLTFTEIPKMARSRLLKKKRKRRRKNDESGSQVLVDSDKGSQLWGTLPKQLTTEMPLLFQISSSKVGSMLPTLPCTIEPRSMDK